MSVVFRQDQMIPVCYLLGERAYLGGEDFAAVWDLAEEGWREAFRRGYKAAERRARARKGAQVKFVEGEDER